MLFIGQQHQQQNGYDEQQANVNGVHDQEVPIDNAAYEEVGNHVVNGEDVVDRDLQNGLQNGHVEVESMQHEVGFLNVGRNIKSGDLKSAYQNGKNYDKSIIYFVYRQIVFNAGIRKEIKIAYDMVALKLIIIILNHFHNLIQKINF